jgi:hypothetical protein
MMEQMARTLQRISATFFYLLGASFFASYLLFRNDMYAVESAWWLQRADLPFALVALLFAGTSFYRSLNRDRAFSPLLTTLTVVPLLVIFLVLVAFNFWEILPFLQGVSIL